MSKTILPLNADDQAGRLHFLLGTKNNSFGMFNPTVSDRITDGLTFVN